MKKNKALIPLFKVFMSPTVMRPLKKTLLSGYIGQGEKVEQFEKALSSFIGMPYILTLNSGTSALHLSLRLLNIGPGDEVISTPTTCTATNWPILMQGAKIVWADINPSTGNIDPNSIASRVTKKTKAILVVDWGGYPCDIDTIRDLCPEIPIIEDAAHAFGAQYKGRMVGQTADFTCFSFQAIKHLTAIDGGALIVKNSALYKRGKLLRWYGIDRETRSQNDRIEIDLQEWGYKYHMNDVAATVGLNNLQYIPTILQKHRKNAEIYKEELAHISSVTLPNEHKNFLSSYWLFTIHVTDVLKFLEYMKTKGIMVSQVHRRNDTHPVVKQFYRPLPGVDAFVRSMISIPVGWWLTKKERTIIIEAIANFS